MSVRYDGNAQRVRENGTALSLIDPVRQLRGLFGIPRLVHIGRAPERELVRALVIKDGDLVLVHGLGEGRVERDALFGTPALPGEARIEDDGVPRGADGDVQEDGSRIGEKVDRGVVKGVGGGDLVRVVEDGGLEDGDAVVVEFGPESDGAPSDGEFVIGHEDRVLAVGRGKLLLVRHTKYEHGASVVKAQRYI